MISASIAYLPIPIRSIVVGFFSESGLDFKDCVHIFGLYVIVVFMGSICVFCIGSSLYLILLKLNLANYITVTLLGGITLLFNDYDDFGVFITFSGFLIAPLYHFYFNKYKVLRK